VPLSDIRDLLRAHDAIVPPLDRSED
jgi:hypothetical protein